ncbi:hypothetical protein [Kitasatospora sp. NBC_01302]|uniref:hypothetical protein n=1 Tax=Kitasatospora sp. NBC_01302 TaxID=2903575 RepID=UPI002E11A281|nr:hypothetical protein OG294_15030 [Kitasatospora sp. NBC_01302]
MSTGPGPETEQFPHHALGMPGAAHGLDAPEAGRGTTTDLAEEAFALPPTDLLPPAELLPPTGLLGGDALLGDASIDADPDAPLGPLGDPVVLEREIRPRRRLRWWQLLPIVLIGVAGSLMFAFPLAFGSGDGGAMVGMLGLLLTSASVGWGGMAARRAGYAWPGLPRRGSGRRAAWQAIAVYTLIACTAFGLAVWRVVQLRS